MWEDVPSSFLQTRRSFSRIRGSYPFRRRARCTAARVDDLSTPRRLATTCAMETSQSYHHTSDIVLDAGLPQRGRRGRVATRTRDISGRLLEERPRNHQGAAIPQTTAQNLDILNYRGSRSQPGPDPLSQTQTHQYPVKAARSSPLRARYKDQGNLPSQTYPQRNTLAVDDKTIEGASHLPEYPIWGSDGLSTSGENSRPAAAAAPPQMAQQQRSGGGLTTSPPPLVPAPMGGVMGPPAGSVMSGWTLAGGQPQMNSVYRLIRKKELQHNYQHRRHPHQYVNELGAGDNDSGSDESQRSVTGMPAPLRQRQPVRGSHGNRDVSPRLGDVHRHHRQVPPPQPKLPAQPRPAWRGDAQQRQRQGDSSTLKSHLGSGLEMSLRPPPTPVSAAAPPLPQPQPPLLVPFASGHAAVDRVVRIRQIEMQRRQRRWNTDGDGDGGSGGNAAAGTDSHREYGSRQANAGSQAGVGTGPIAAPTPTHMAPMTREGVWAIDKVPTALLGGRAGAVWGHGGNERRADDSGGIGGLSERDVIEVMLASPSGDGDGDGGGGGGSERGVSGRGGNDGEGNSVSSLLRETLISDLSLLNPVYRMIRKHELLQRHPHPGANKTSGSSSRIPSAAGTASSPFVSSPASSIDPWGTDDFADVMLGGLMLAPPPPAPSASDLESTSESGSGSIFGSGFADAASGTTSSSRHATTDTAGAVQEAGRLNPVLRLIRKKQLQRRLRLRGRLGPDIPILATPSLSAPLTAGASVSMAAADGSDDGAMSYAVRPMGGSRTGSGDTVAEAAAWEIGPADAVGGRAVLNPVYRLIRKKQLQSKRASREASAAAAAAAAADSSSRGSLGADDASNLSPFCVSKGAGSEATTWLPRRAPFFDLGVGDYPFRSPASTLADALDPMGATSGFGSQPGSGSHSAAASRNGLGVVIQIDNAETAAAASEPQVWPRPLPGSRVSDELASSMVGERPHMNHVYRLIRKKELQLRQRGVLSREAPAAGLVEGSTSTAHRDGGGDGGGSSSAAADASISSGRSAPALLPLPLTPMAVVSPAAAVRPSSSSRPPALLHPFDPVEDQDGGAVSGGGAARVLTGYSRRLLMGGTYDEEQDEVYGDAGDDEGTFWSAASEEDSWDELIDDHEEALSSSRIAGIEPASLVLGPWPEVNDKQPEAAAGPGLRAGAVDVTEINTASDAPEMPQGLGVKRRGRRRKQDDRRVTVSDEKGGKREKTAVVVQDSDRNQMALAIRGEQPDNKEATVAAGAVEAANENGEKGQSQQQRLHLSHEAIPTGAAVTATATVTALEGGLKYTSTARPHVTERRGRGRRASTTSDQDASLVAAGKELTVAAETNFVAAAASITKTDSSSNGPKFSHGDDVCRGEVSRGAAPITPRRRRIEQLKASLRAKLLQLATTGPGGGGGGGGGANTNRPLSLLSGPPSGFVSEPSQRHCHLPPLSPTASPQAAALDVTSMRNKESIDSAETAAAGAGAIGASHGAATTTTKAITYPASITAALKPQASRSDAVPADADSERELARDSAVAVAATAWPLPWQLARRGTATTRDSVSSIASVSAGGRSRIQIRRTGTAHRPPGLLRFLLETSPGPDGAEFSYGTQAAVQSTGGPQPDGSGGGDGVSSASVRTPRRLFSGIAQLWDAVGLRVGPLPPVLPHVDLDAMAATAATSVRDLVQLEKLLIQEGVSETTARRLSSSWLVQSRGWEPENVVERLRGLQRVLAWPVPSSVPHARTPVPEGTGAVPPVDAQYTPVPECSHEAHEDNPGAGATVGWPRTGAGGGDAAAATIITAEPGIAVAAAAAAKQPNLLTRDPAVLETNLGTLATTLRMDRHGAQKLARTWPSLLELRPASLAERLMALATGLGRIDNRNSTGFQYGDKASLIHADNAVVVVGDDDGDDDNCGDNCGDGSADKAMPAGEPSQTLQGAISLGAIESAADFVRRYPPALALTQTAVAARMRALSSAIAGTLQEQERQQVERHGLSEEPLTSPKPSVFGGAAALSQTEHSTCSCGPSEVPSKDLCRNTAEDSSSRAESGTAAATITTCDPSPAATMRALELVSGHPGILGYSPDALAARWRALEAAITRAEAEFLQAVSQEEYAALDLMALQGNGRVMVQRLQTSLNHEREPHLAPRQGQGLRKGIRETTLRLEVNMTGLDRTSPGFGVEPCNSLETKGPVSRAGALPWRRQLLEGPPAAVARCLAASEERLQRLAFLASNVGGGATSGNNAAASDGHEAGGSVDGMAAAGSSAPIGKTDETAISKGKGTVTVASDLKLVRRGRGSQRKERLVAQRHEHATSSVAAADARESTRTVETVVGSPQRLKSLSLCTILAMSNERFDKRFPDFAAWVRLQQETGAAARAGAQMKRATRGAAILSPAGPAKTARTEQRQVQRRRR